MQRRWTSMLGSGLAGVLAAFAGDGAQANPQGGTVVGGSATISTQPGQTVIDQHTRKAAIDWAGGFNIGTGETTIFRMPDANSIALNRDFSGDASQLFGTLLANGKVWVINPNGVMIGRDAKINTNGFLATTTDIGTADFLAGVYRFDQPSPNPSARVVNEGEIDVGATGLAALVAPEVRNDGSIVATLGQVVLAGAERFTLDLQGDGLIQFVLPQAGATGKTPFVGNNGVIRADGGQVLLAAASVADVVGQVINMSGVIEARAVSRDGGSIVLDGGDGGTVRVAGLVNASAATADGRGGTVKVLGQAVELDGAARIDATGTAGGGAALIGGNWQGSGPERKAGRTAVAAGAVIDASATGRGDGGTAVVWSEQETRFAGKISARGGERGGNGGRAEVSGRRGLEFTGFADLRAPAGKTGTLLLDPNNIVIADITTSDGSVIAASRIEELLQFANVTVQTGNPDPVTPPQGGVSADPLAEGDGDIFVDAPITAPASANALTLDAHDDIVLGQNIDMSASSGGLTLRAGPDGDIVPAGGTIAPGVGAIDLRAGGNIGVDLAAGGSRALVRAESTNGDILISAPLLPEGLTLASATAERGGIRVAVDGPIEVSGRVAAAATAGEEAGESYVPNGDVNLYASAQRGDAGIGTLTLNALVEGAAVNLRAAGDIGGTGAIAALRLDVVYGASDGRTLPGADSLAVRLNGDNRVDAVQIRSTTSSATRPVEFRNAGPRTPGMPLTIDGIRARTLALFAANRVELDGRIVADGPNAELLTGAIPGGRAFGCPYASICLASLGFADNNEGRVGVDPGSGRFVVYSRNFGEERISDIYAKTYSNRFARGIEEETSLVDDNTNYFLYPTGDTVPELTTNPEWLPSTEVAVDIGSLFTSSVHTIEEPPELFVAYQPATSPTDEEELHAIEGNERLWR